MDNWAALFAAGFIVYSAIGIIRPALGEIMDKALENKLLEEVRKIAAAKKEVKRVEKCFICKMRFDYFVDIHIEVDADLTVADGHLIVHAAKDHLIKYNKKIRDALVHIEPYFLG